MFKQFFAVLLGFLPAFSIGILTRTALFAMLEDCGCSAHNFKGIKVVNCAGIAIPASLIGALVFIALLSPSAAAAMTPLLALVSGASLFGFIDDMLGSGFQKGFKGHFKSLLSGRLTTGALKAIGIGALALAVSLSRAPTFAALVDAAVIALCVNMLNLLDLRPGRAIKVFMLLDGLLALLAPIPYSVALAAGLGAGAAVLEPDLKEKTMLGDVGSNALGGIVGIGVIYSAGLPVKLAVLAALLSLQLYAEKYSLTDLIARVTVLRRLDEWGRGEVED